MSATVMLLPSYLGQLAAPTNLIITAMNMTTWHLSWQAPFTLNISSTPTYFIWIKDTEQGTSVNVTTVHTEYYHHPSSCQRRAYEVCVAAGYEPESDGPYSEPVGMIHKCK